MITILFFLLIPIPLQDHENQKMNDKPKEDHFPQVLDEQPMPHGLLQEGAPT
jgi:hypothetical protein